MSNIRRHACACGLRFCVSNISFFFFSLFAKIERLCHSMSGWNRMNPNHFWGTGSMYDECRHTEYTHTRHTQYHGNLTTHRIHSIHLVSVGASWNRKRRVDISYSNAYMSTHVRLGSRAVIWSVFVNQAKDAETMKSSAFFFLSIYFLSVGS